MTSSFVFIVAAPEGILRACFRLEPGRRYRPDDVSVERGGAATRAAHTLTVNATVLPSEDEFRVLAARAASRSADQPGDPVSRLLRLLIPF